MKPPTMTDAQYAHVCEQFGAAVRECREHADATQDDWAAWLGVAQTTVSHWEKGHGLPRARTLYKLAKWMGVSLDYLFGLSRNRHHEQSRARAQSATAAARR